MATSGIYTLLGLRTLAKQRADMEKSQFVTDTEWNTYVNDSLKELYDLIIQKYGDDYYVNSVNIDTDGESTTYALPNGTNYSAATPFYKLLGVDVQLSNTQDSWATIRSFSFQERNRFSSPASQSYYGRSGLRYRIQGGNLWFTPTPISGQVIRVWYVPRCITLVEDTDETDCFGGWGEYVAIDAAGKAFIKQELDASQLAAQKSAMIARIESVAENRDAANPACVTDASAQGNTYPYGGHW